MVVGVLLRLLCVLFLVPKIHQQLFHPFLVSLAENPTVDPWSQWLDLGGRPDAFPYGPVLVLFLMPLGFLEIGTATIIFGILVLIVDTAVCFMLVTSRCSVQALALWSIGVIPLFTTFIHGQTDIFLCGFISASLFALTNKRWGLSGALLALATATKLSGFILLPFICIFTFDNPRYRRGAKTFMSAFAAVALIGHMPAVYSAGFRNMAIDSPEGLRLLDYGLSLRTDYVLLVLPLVYLGMLYLLWRVGRTTISTLIVFCSAALFFLAVITPGTIGWYLWGLPVFILCVDRLKPRLILPLYLFQCLAAFYYIRKASGAHVRFFDLELDPIAVLVTARQNSLLQTLVFGCGIVLIAATVHDARSKADIFLIGRAPLAIGIAGDSATGKDTLASAIASFFPQGSSRQINGDDYHRFERGHSAWRRMTHLLPSANDLERQSRDVALALKRRPVHTREYSHTSGKFGPLRVVKPADLVIVNGLHSLMLGDGVAYDAAVFLEMDEDLRVTLKLRRDSTLRGASYDEVYRSVLSRREDYTSYVLPQKARAGISFRVMRPTPQDIELRDQLDWDFNSDELVTIEITTEDRAFIDLLVSVLSSVALIRTELDENYHNSVCLRCWPGSLTQQEILQIARLMAGDVEEVIGHVDSFHSGVSGFMGITTLAFALNVRRRGQLDATRSANSRGVGFR